MSADGRVDDLEFRLHRYHEWLVEAIAERDRLALDAAWGVHWALYYNLALAAFVVYLSRSADSNPWWANAGAVVLFVIAQSAIGIWSNGARLKEVGRLAKLPEWEWKTT